MMYKFGKRTCYLNGSIRAARINDDNFIGPGQAPQAPRDITLLVETYYACGNQHTNPLENRCLASRGRIKQKSGAGNQKVLVLLAFDKHNGCRGL